MGEKLDPRIAFEDARHRQAAVVSLIQTIDAQAMRLMSLYVTLGSAAAAGSVSVLASANRTMPAAVGWALLAAVACLLIGSLLCFQAMKTSAISLPGRTGEFWLWSLEDQVTPEAVLRSYLENLKEKDDQNYRLNVRMARFLNLGKWAGICTPVAAALAGAIAAALRAN